MERQLIIEIEKQPPIIGESPTSPKHHLIKERLNDAISVVPRGTRLPTLRELAELFNTTQHPVQKAINSLVADGVLYSRPRSGVFVADSHKNISYRNDVIPVREIKLYIDNLLPRQKLFWLNTISEFEKEHRLIRIKLEENRNTQDSYDILVSNPRILSSEDSLNYLEVNSFFSDIDETTSSNINVIRNFHIPIFFNVPCIFYNKNLLAELGLEIPSTDDFNQQCVFLEKIIENSQQLDSSAKPLANALQMIVWLGSKSQDIVNFIRENQDNGNHMDALNSELDSFIDFYRFINQNKTPTIEGDMMRIFIDGQVVAFMGWNYNTEALNVHQPDFQWEMKPFISYDDIVFATPFTLAIKKETPCPIECVRFLKYLLSEKSQISAAKYSGIPVGPLVRQTLRQTDEPDNNTLLKEIQQLRMSEYKDAADVYLNFNLINDEIWRAVDAENYDKSALKNIVSLGRAYFQTIA